MPTNVSHEQFNLLMRAVGNIHLRVAGLERLLTSSGDLQGQAYSDARARFKTTQHILDELERSPGLEG